MTRVLVTAATGTVGRHVVAELAATDVLVRAGTRDPTVASDREPRTISEYVGDYAAEFQQPGAETSSATAP